MSENNTVTFHRVIKASPDKIFRAFVEPDALARWLPPHGFTCSVEHMDAKAGGSFKMAFRNFTTGHSHSFGGSYIEFLPGQKLVYTDKFDDPNMPGEMKVTVLFKAVSVGTELNIEQSGIPAMIPLEFCYLGWQESLQYLVNLVEPEITQG